MGMGRRGGRTAWVAGVVALGLTSACGTTVSSFPPSGQAPARTGGTSSAELPTGLAPLTTSPVGVARIAPPAGVQPGTDGYGGSSPSEVASRALLDGPGVTTSTITFGVPFALDTGAANAAAAGAGNIDPGDLRDYYNILVADVNRTGGVAGRRLVPAYYQTSTMSSESAESQLNAACQHWAYDVKAFVFLDARLESARACAEQHGMLSFSGGGNAVTRTFLRYPHYLEPSGVALEDYEGATVSGLAKTDYYGKAPVIGIVTWDHPDFRTAVRDGMVPELAKLGFKPKVVSYVKVPASYADAGGTSASVSSAVLKFRQEGVTHVFIADGPAGVALGLVITALWIKAAGSQGYYPRYGFNDLNGPQAALDAHLWGPDDVRGARVVTASNADDRTDAGVAPNRARIACLALMRRHGMPMDNIEAKFAMIHACDNIWFLRAVLGTARAPVNRDRFVALTEALGTTYRGPATYRNELSPTRHGGVAGFRRMALDDGCGCYKYISGIYGW